MIDGHKRVFEGVKAELVVLPPKLELVGGDLFDLLSLLGDARKALEGVPFRIKQEERIELMDYRVDGTIVVLLFCHSDGAASDPTLRDPTADRMRTMGKQPEEGLAHSAHLAIDTQATDDGTYRAILERAPKLSRSILARVLNAGLSGYSWHLRDPDKTPVKPRIRLAPHTSAELVEQLENGRLLRLELIKEPGAENAGVGEGFLMARDERMLKLDPARPSTWSWRTALGRVMEWGRNDGYQQVRVHVKDNRTSRTRSHILPSGLELETFLCSRRFTHAFEQTLAAAPVRVVPEVAEVMIDSLRTG